MDLNSEQGLESIGEFVHRDKDGNIKGTGSVLARKGSVERDANGVVTGFTGADGLHHEVNNNDGSN